MTEKKEDPRKADLRRLESAARKINSARCWLAELEREEVSLSFVNDGQVKVIRAILETLEAQVEDIQNEIKKGA